jgi:hypothetical protein
MSWPAIRARLLFTTPRHLWLVTLPGTNGFSRAVRRRVRDPQRPGSSLVARVHAPDSCQPRDCRAGSVKAVFACTFTGHLDRYGCPACTDGLDGFCPPRTIGQWEHGHLMTAVRQRRSGILWTSRQPTGAWRRRSGSAGVRAESAARAARRAALKAVQKALTGRTARPRTGRMPGTPAERAAA